MVEEFPKIDDDLDASKFNVPPGSPCLTDDTALIA